MKNFVLNTKTGVLHYKGLCCHTKNLNRDFAPFKFFSSENAARARGAISVRWCKLCAEKRK